MDVFRSSMVGVALPEVGGPFLIPKSQTVAQLRMLACASSTPFGVVGMWHRDPAVSLTLNRRLPSESPLGLHCRVAAGGHK